MCEQTYELRQRLAAAEEEVRQRRAECLALANREPRTRLAVAPALTLHPWQDHPHCLPEGLLNWCRVDERCVDCGSDRVFLGLTYTGYPQGSSWCDDCAGLEEQWEQAPLTVVEHFLNKAGCDVDYQSLDELLTALVTMSTPLRERIWSTLRGQLDDRVAAAGQRERDRERRQLERTDAST